MSDLPPDEPAAPYRHISFHTLALDVLSGLPRPRGSAPGLKDSYEVWGYRHDPGAVVILRGFQGGDVLACAVYTPPALATDERYAGAVERLIALRVPGMVYASRHGLLSDVELLDTAPAFERIARALALDGALEVGQNQPGLYGVPDALTIDYLELLESLDPRQDAGDDAQDDESLSHFEYLTDLLCEDPEGLRWSGAREKAGAERIDVLVHATDPDTTILIYFPPEGAPAEVSVYLPPVDDDARHDALLDDVAAMLKDRDLGGPAPKPLAAQGRFRRLSAERAIAQAEMSSDALADGDGCTHEFTVGPLGAEPRE